MAIKKKIVDTGITYEDGSEAYITGAHKERAFQRFSKEQIAEMNADQLRLSVNKKNMFPRPDWDALIDEQGKNKFQVYYAKNVYDSIRSSYQTMHVSPESYYEFIDVMKGFINKVIDDESVDFMFGLKNHDYFTKLVEDNDWGNYDSKFWIGWTPHGDIGNALIDRKNPTFKYMTKTTFGALANEVYREKFHVTEREIADLKIKVIHLDGKPYELNQWSNGEYEIRENDSNGHFIGCFTLRTSGQKIETNDYIILSDYNEYHKLIGVTKDYEEARKMKEEYLNKAVALREKINSEKQTETKEKKKKFTPKLIQNIQRNAPSCLRGIDVGTEDIIKTFGLKSIQVGETLSEVRKQYDMNLAYEAFKDLSKTLGMTEKSVSLGGRLSYGDATRGVPNAAGQFEPGGFIIQFPKKYNMTCLAHEWAHALDAACDKYPDLKDEVNKIKSSLKYKPGTPDPDKVVNDNFSGAFSWVKYSSGFEKLSPEIAEKVEEKFKEKMKQSIHVYKSGNTEDFFQGFSGGWSNYTLKKTAVNNHDFYMDDFNEFYKKTTGIERGLDTDRLAKLSSWMRAVGRDGAQTSINTDYLNESKQFDRMYNKDYYATDKEMFARAFDLYIEGKASEVGIKTDTLSGQTHDGSPIPKNEEAETFKTMFDNLIQKCKDAGLLEQGITDYNEKLRDVLETDYSLNDEQIDKIIENIEDDTTIEDIEKQIADGKEIAQID